jgi:6-phosphogluconolactonase
MAKGAAEHSAPLLCNARSIAMTSSTRRRALASIVSVPLAAAGLVPGTASAHLDDEDDTRSGLVFTSSNDSSGNELLVFARGADGTLSLSTKVSTGGVGSGAGLGSQGAVTLSDDGRRLYVVNAGSNTVSTFVLDRQGIHLRSVVHSSGLHPISVTEDGGLVYVLNDGGAGNIAGFRDRRGELEPLVSSARALSTAGGSGPAQVSFADQGRVLVVTEKATNRLVSWAVGPSGLAGPARVVASPGQTPFGFGVTRSGRVVVSEAWGGAAGASTVSSWAFDGPSSGAHVVSGAIANGQAAACWVAVTPNGRHAYVANTGSSTLSQYAVRGDGQLTLIDGAAAQTGSGSAPADTAVSANGRRVHVRNGRTATIASYAIGEGGRLGTAHLTNGLPATAVGLAAN